MSKMYDKYLELKRNSKKYMYLFECGNFYIFLDTDAKKVSDLFGLKLTEFNKSILKCGFPKISLTKYLDLFKTKKLKVVVIESLKKEQKNVKNDIVEILRKTDLNYITPLEAFEILKKLKELID